MGGLHGVTFGHGGGFMTSRGSTETNRLHDADGPGGCRGGGRRGGRGLHSGSHDPLNELVIAIVQVTGGLAAGTAVTGMGLTTQPPGFTRNPPCFLAEFEELVER